MKNRHMGRYLIGTLMAFGLLAGCNSGSETPKDKTDEAKKVEAEQPSGQVLATVNGQPITREDLMAFLQYKQQVQPGQPINPGMLLNEMINTLLLAQEAEKRGLDQQEAFKRQMAVHRAAILVNMLVTDFLNGLDLSDEELRKEYEAQIAGIDKTEYKARHILLKDKAKAEKLIARLKPDGSNFAEMAKQHSIGPSGKNGGDLGWFSATSMVPEFADAVKNMEKGEISREPVRTEFGWHIIWLEDMRQTDVPSFEESRERLKMIVAQKKLQQFITELREKGNIEIKGASSRTPPAALENAGNDAEQGSLVPPTSR